MDDTRTLIDAAVEHLPQATISATPDYPQVAVITEPNNHKVRFEDMERFADAPRRVRQLTTHETPKSFTDYVTAFEGPGTRVFASLAEKKIEARIDDHVAGLDGHPSWVEHRAVYPAAFDPAFSAWHRVQGQFMEQRTFADFLEDRAEDALVPEPADLMEVAQRFEAIRNVDFKTVVNVATNERQFRYDEKDSVGGAVTCPRMIQLSTPVFYGCPKVLWGARLAYKIDGGTLLFKVVIHRLQELLDAEFGRLVESIAVDMPAVPIHRGTANGARGARGATGTD